MIRETSIECYKQIVEKGLLSKKRLEIYKVIHDNGAMTSAEAFSIILRNKSNMNVLTQSRARFTELRDMGVLYECGERTCRITKRKAIVWEIKDQLPIELPKKKTRKEKVDEALGMIEELSSNISEENKEDLREIYRAVRSLK